MLSGGKQLTRLDVNNGLHMYRANFSNFICTKLLYDISSTPAMVCTSWGMWALWLGQPYNEAAFLISIGTLCPFKKKHFEGSLSLHLRACEQCCAEREPAWVEPKGIRLTLLRDLRTDSQADWGTQHMFEIPLTVLLIDRVCFLFFCTFWVGALIPH